MSDQFTHLDQTGNPSMVNVGGKIPSLRTAVAQSIVILPENVLNQLDNKEITTPKGAVFQTAILAGIMGAKKTGELIPLCHPIGMDNCQISINLNDNREVVIECTASVFAKTGVEMEAMTGATIAALTIYDMCKAFTHDIIIKETKLMAKTGGKRDFHRKEK